MITTPILPIVTPEDTENPNSKDPPIILPEIPEDKEDLTPGDHINVLPENREEAGSVVSVVQPIPSLLIPQTVGNTNIRFNTTAVPETVDSTNIIFSFMAVILFGVMVFALRKDVNYDYKTSRKK